MSYCRTRGYGERKTRCNTRGILSTRGMRLYWMMSVEEKLDEDEWPALYTSPPAPRVRTLLQMSGNTFQNNCAPQIQFSNRECTTPKGLG